MSVLDFRRGVTGVRLLLEYGLEQGLAAAALLHGSGIEAASLTDPEAELTATQELRVAHNLAQALRHPPGLGLALGARYRLSNFGLWGYGLMSSPDLGAALALAIRYLPLTFAFSAITLQLREDSVALAFSEPELPAGPRRMLVERDMAAAAALMQQLGGPSFRLTRFELKAVPGRAGVRPPDAAPILGVMPVHAGRQYLLAFDRQFLALRPPQADPASAALCERLCQDLLARRRAHIGTVAMVEHLVATQPEGSLPQLAHLARQLSTSERTLKRRLQAEGLCFRDLLARHQARVAAELLADPALSAGAVAARLGYADLSSFSQAFKRWHGLSPDAFRRRQGPVHSAPLTRAAAPRSG